MPRTEPIVRDGVYDRREKITVGGHTATRGHFQHLKRQSLKEKYKGQAQGKRLAASTVISSQVIIAYLLTLPRSFTRGSRRPKYQQQRRPCSTCRF